MFFSYSTYLHIEFECLKSYIKKLRVMESQKKKLQSKLNDSINKKKDMQKGLNTMEQQKIASISFSKNTESKN